MINIQLGVGLGKIHKVYNIITFSINSTQNSDGSGCQMSGSGRVRVLKKISGLGFQVYTILDFWVFRVCKKIFEFRSGSAK